MAHSNSTQYYSLPQFDSTDKPAWLVDVNPAYAAIDTGIHAAKAAADAAQGDATQALSDASAAGTTASGADAKASGAIASIAENFDSTSTYSIGEYVMYNNLLYVCTTAVVTPGPWTGSTNWNRTTIDNIASDFKIEELSNVSLTSSDDGKLLGVSVSGGDISVGAANVSNNITLDNGAVYSTYINNKFDNYYNQYGNLLLFTLDFEMKARSASSGWAEIFKTPSAISLKNAVIVSCISSLNHWNRVRINSDGTVNLNLVSASEANERISIQILAFLA